MTEPNYELEARERLAATETIKDAMRRLQSSTVKPVDLRRLVLELLTEELGAPDRSRTGVSLAQGVVLAPVDDWLERKRANAQKLADRRAWLRKRGQSIGEDDGPA